MKESNVLVIIGLALLGLMAFASFSNRKIAADMEVVRAIDDLGKRCAQ